MESKINIGEKELELRSSLLTIIAYKSTFGTDLFEDISNLAVQDGKEGISNISTVIRVLFQIIYILHKPFTQQSFEQFVNEFDFSVLSDTTSLEQITSTIGEVLGSVQPKSKSTFPTK